MPYFNQTFIKYLNQFEPDDLLFRKMFCYPKANPNSNDLIWNNLICFELTALRSEHTITIHYRLDWIGLDFYVLIWPNFVFSPRLWGLDAQKRLRSAKVCLIGMRGLGCEVRNMFFRVFRGWRFILAVLTNLKEQTKADV